MKKIKICVPILAAAMLTACGAEKPSAEIETTTAAAVTETSETVSETEVTTETTTTATVAETAETSASEENLTVSPSGYVLDPGVTLGEENAWNFPEGKPCLIGEPADGVRFYGVNGGEEKEYTYYTPNFGESEYDQYVIIEHDGTAEEFPCPWSERFGTAMFVYSGDFDGDGETEIATHRYATGGTFCSVDELVLYKLADGRYRQFVFSPTEFNDEYINLEIDSENKSLTISVKGFEETFTYDFSGAVPPEMTEYEVDMLSINEFEFDGGKITYKIYPLLQSYTPIEFAEIRFGLDLSEGKFICTDVEFAEN
ncbi:MAG: hypothetical protein NC085_09675 [Muribaculaceae bacterium]|nr:hypothetical protein [Muribaculaceae bacterium]MCM1479963.1 hypothetical protein [Muribaculaceae bacterium]